MTIDLSNYLPSDFYDTITLSVKWKEKTDAEQDNPKSVTVGFYSLYGIDNYHKLYQTYTEHTDADYIDVKENMAVMLYGNFIYVTLTNSYYVYGYITDFSVDVIYPDTTKLYL